MPKAKISREIHDKIISCVRAGNYFEIAAAFAGIHKTTFYDWLKRGRSEPKGQYKDLVDDLQIALGAAEVRDVAVIAKASETHWQAAAWRLERKFPDRWGRRQAIQVSDSSTLMETQEIDLARLSTDELETLNKILTKKTSKPAIAAVVNEEPIDDLAS